jgi:riboflavin synthase
MFTGIIRARGKIKEIRTEDAAPRLLLESGLFETPPVGQAGTLKIGDSISVQGVCLTVVELDNGSACFDLSSETLRRTTLGKLRSGSEVNLEPSLRLGDSLDGHLVQGHIDAVARVMNISEEGNTLRLEFSLPSEISRYVVAKGAVTVDGVSLTVGEVGRESFSVYIIPHTRSETTLKDLVEGSFCNVEADSVARYLAHLAEPYGTVFRQEKGI